MSEDLAKLIAEGKRRAALRNSQWLDLQDELLAQEDQFLRETWKYLVIPATTAEIDPEELKTRAIQLLQDHLLALTRA